MSRKRDTTPETLLRAVIQALEDDRPRDGVLQLLAFGPLDTRTAWQRELETPAIEAFDEPVSMAAMAGSELLAFLRQAVCLRGVRGHSPSGLATGYPITTNDMVIYNTTVDARGELVVIAEGSVRDLAIVQCLALLRLVDFRYVIACRAGDCPRIVVKTYRREYCSDRCQKRARKRIERQAAPKRQARQHTGRRPARKG